MAKKLKDNTKDGGLSPSHAVALDTLSGVLTEMARLYRLALKGTVTPDKMTKFIYALREIRACIEISTLEDVQKQLATLSLKLAARHE